MLAIYERDILLGKLDAEFSAIKHYLMDAVEETEIHQVEKELFARLQEIGRMLLNIYIKEHGTGYNETMTLHSQTGKRLRYKGLVKRQYFSIFGEIEIERAGYATGCEGYFYPVDQQLNLPEGKYSYLLRKWIESRAVESDFREALSHFNEMFDFTFFPTLPQRLAKEASIHVGRFYEEQEPPVPATEGSHIGISMDGKGIRILKSERADKPPKAQQFKARRSKGEKPGIKKEAIVTVDFTFKPLSRDPEEIVKALLNEYSEQERREYCRRNRQWSLNKHMRATLAGKEVAAEYLLQRVLKRDPHEQKPIIVLIDGDPSLERALRNILKAHHLLERVDGFILDIIHVCEYLWKAAAALYGEKSKGRIGWVRQKLLAILNSKVGYVISSLKQLTRKRKLSQGKRKTLQTVITYFENHKHMMDYAACLEKGYPIATGLVEGSCGSLVKDRMEQSGMRWSLNGAQAVLDLRAVKKNNDWEQFWESIVNAEKNRLYHPEYQCQKDV